MCISLGDGLPRDYRDTVEIHPEAVDKGYLRDQACGQSCTNRHSNLYLQAMELVRLRDTSASAYEKLTGLFKDNLHLIRNRGMDQHEATKHWMRTRLKLRVTTM